MEAEIVNDDGRHRGNLRLKAGLPVPAAAGAVLVGGAVTAVVLLAVGISLIIAGVAVLAGLAATVVTVPIALAGWGRRRLKGSQRVLDVEAEVKSLDPPHEQRKRLREILQAVEDGRMAPEDALDQLP